jgi:hypothetical protein
MPFKYLTFKEEKEMYFPFKYLTFKEEKEMYKRVQKIRFLREQSHKPNSTNSTNTFRPPVECPGDRSICREALVQLDYERWILEQVDYQFPFDHQ